MFVIDNAVADRDWDGVTGTINSVIERHGGKVVDLRKWDERRLSYVIGRVKRAAYVLVHFEAPPAGMEQMYKDFVLAENIVRQLITVDVDGIPTGDQRPGITTSLTESLPGRRPRGRRRVSTPETAGADEAEDDRGEGGDEDNGDETAGEADRAEEAPSDSTGTPREPEDRLEQ